MPTITCAPSRHSILSKFGAGGLEALAIAGLLLLDRINCGALIVSDQVEPVLVDRTCTLIDRLYGIQECLHGSDAGLDEALRSLLDGEAFSATEKSNG